MKDAGPERREAQEAALVRARALWGEAGLWRRGGPRPPAPRRRPWVQRILEVLGRIARPEMPIARPEIDEETLFQGLTAGTLPALPDPRPARGRTRTRRTR